MAVPTPQITPTYQGNQSYASGFTGSTQEQNYANQAATQNQFTPGQQQLQGMVPGMFANFLSGNVPTSFTAPQQVIDAYQQNFRKMVQPGLAAQYGTGSPQIAAQQTYGLGQLLGNLYQSGLSNYAGALNAAGNYGLTPTGAATNNQGTQKVDLSGNQFSTSGNQFDQSLLSWLMGVIGQTI